MDCIVLAGSGERRMRLQWQLEDLGEDWRCLPATRPEQALQMLRGQWFDLVVATERNACAALENALRAQPPLAPPCVLGEGFAGPDGPLPALSALPGMIQARYADGLLPALSGLRLQETTALAQGLLHALGVPPRLRAWRFLPGMAALTAVHPPLLTDLQHRLYPLIARRSAMTPAAVERSLRLCVESTWSRGSLEALERFFGSSVDPERGKPTNREFLCRIQERLTLAAGRLGG